LKVKVLCLLVLVLALSQFAPPTAGQVQQSSTGEDAPASFDERLGPDDGAALAILIGANQRGNLDLCDCSHPRGGLARRVGYVSAFKQKFKETPVLQVDAGFLFYGAAGYPKYAMVMNDQVVRAYSRWTLDVVNLGRLDLIYAQKLFAREGLAERITESPILKNMISANGVFQPGVEPPPGYIVKEVTGPRLPRGGKLKIAFVGLAEPQKASGGLAGNTVTNMFETARRKVLEAKKDADLVVIVAHAEWEGSRRLATENPEADIVISGNAEGFFKPVTIGKVLVVPASPGNMKQGDLRVYFDKAGNATFKFKATDLDELVPADAAALAFMDAARSERQRR
jgi:2',3'-cyclic-nucleotide 2'-phosphodiesterase (5'-nucleotidase family)